MIMAEVLSVSLEIDGYLHPASSRCRSPHSTYDNTNAPDMHPYQKFNSLRHNSISSIPSSASQSPELSGITDSTLSSSTSSLASSVDLEDRKPSELEMNESVFFPLYEYHSVPVPQSSHDDSMPSMREQENQIQENPVEHQPKAEVTTEVGLLGPSDDSLVREEPSRHVDYLSHEWKEEDIWASWRYMVTKRKVYSNAARLENASWRTWIKKKYNLKTVSPAKLNW